MKKSIPAERLTDPAQIIEKHINKMQKEFMVAVDVPDRMKIASTSTTENKGIWNGLKSSFSKQMESVFRKKEEIIISIVIRLLLNYYYGQLDKHGNKIQKNKSSD